jgi:hypothetical protein
MLCIRGANTNGIGLVVLYGISKIGKAIADSMSIMVEDIEKHED